jgi:hypothetical protein
MRHESQIRSAPARIASNVDNQSSAPPNAMERPVYLPRHVDSDQTGKLGDPHVTDIARQN